MNLISKVISKFSRMIQSYSFSSVQADFPSDISQKIINWGLQNIPTDDLAADGREDDIHVTVRYGLHGHDPAEVSDLVVHQKPFKFSLGAISIFENGEHDVVKLDVKSPDLIHLNKILSALEHTDTHKTYISHCTLAYVKPGLGKKYVGRKDFEDIVIPVDSVVFSGNDNRKTVLPLLGGMSKMAFIRIIADLVEHAHKELELAGLLDKDADYGGELGKNILELIATFAQQGHSGFSAQMAVKLFNDLANYRPLSPVTTDEDEWMLVGKDLWQNKRNPEVFSTNNGKTHYNVNKKEETIRTRSKKAFLFDVGRVKKLYKKLKENLDKDTVKMLDHFMMSVEIRDKWKEATRLLQGWLDNFPASKDKIKHESMEKIREWQSEPSWEG